MSAYDYEMKIFRFINAGQSTERTVRMLLLIYRKSWLAH